MSCLNPYAYLDVILRQTTGITNFLCRVCNVSSQSFNYLDDRTSDIFVICSACIRIWRICDWLQVDSTRVWNWNKLLDGLGEFSIGGSTRTI